jgi:hypothetical protein
MKKRKILSFFLILIAGYFVWLTLQLIIFKSYTTVPQKDSSLEVAGAFHIHSAFSDGRSSVEKIAKCAADRSLDFIVVTDHGRPNYESLRSQGWKEGVLVLCGSELSQNRGHLVAVGFTVIAHPYSKVLWSWGPEADYSGIEIISADSMLKRSLPLSLFYLPALLLDSKFAFLKVLERPEKNLLKWDSLNEDQRIFGYYSVDAHLLYNALFSSLQLHVPLSKPLATEFGTASRQVFDALRHGNFYNAVDGAAQAKGFRFWATQADKVFPMGSRLSIETETTLHAAMPVGVTLEAQILQSGTPVFRSNEQRWSYPVTKGPGTYRVEVYLKERSPMSKDIPWILSNPIFLEERND